MAPHRRVLHGEPDAAGEQCDESPGLELSAAGVIGCGRRGKPSRLCRSMAWTSARGSPLAGNQVEPATGGEVPAASEPCHPMSDRVGSLENRRAASRQDSRREAQLGRRQYRSAWNSNYSWRSGMAHTLVCWVIALATIVALDAVWLGLLMRRFYSTRFADRPHVRRIDGARLARGRGGLRPARGRNCRVRGAAGRGTRPAAVWSTSAGVVTYSVRT